MANGQVGSGQSGCRSKTGHLSGLKTGLDQSGCELGRVYPYFSHAFFFLKKKNKENNMYLPLKSCNKSLDVKCITLNLPLISRMNFDNSLILHIYIIIRKHYHTYFELIHAFYSWFWNNTE